MHQDMIMKLRLLVILGIFAFVLFLFFSGNYVYLEESSLVVQPSAKGTPMLTLGDETFYVRHWTLAPGCYKLTRIGLLDYNMATQTDESRCAVQAKSY
jgi:hypothetical protein